MSKKKNSVEYDLFADFRAVDEGNIVAGVVMQAVEETQKHKSEKKFNQSKFNRIRIRARQKGLLRKG